MQTKYAIFNPADGTYTYKDTYEDACLELVSVGYEFYKLHCHGHPCAYVEVQDDGSEIWKNSDGVVVPSPADVQKQIKKQALMMASITSNFGTLPTVTL